MPRSRLRGDARNVFEVTDQRRFTHVRLSVFPDGGVARLRVAGSVIPDPRGLERLTVDLAGQEFGGLVTASSDDFYTAASTLNRPDTARTMGEGWETQRRRDGGHDYAVLTLGLPGQIRQVIADTAHFKYNASAEIAVFGWPGIDRNPADRNPADRNLWVEFSGHGPDKSTQPSRLDSRSSAEWQPLLPRTRLQPDTRHVLPVRFPGPVSAVRIDAFPDGGLSRVRVIGAVDPAARRAAGYRWFNALPAAQAVRMLAGEGVDRALAAEVTGRRPLAGDQWLDDIRRAASRSDADTLARLLHGAY